MRSTKHTSPTELTHLSSEMSEHEHSLVRYTGGWAAAEAGTLRFRERASDTRTRSASLPGRLQALEAAQRIWEGVGKGFREARGNDSPRFVIIPASVRQDHNAWGALRSDLVAVSMESTHPKSLIQISSEWDPRRSIKMRFLIEAPKDISLSGIRPRDTFRRLLERERGAGQPALSSRLDALSQSLVDRLAAFTPA